MTNELDPALIGKIGLKEIDTCLRRWLFGYQSHALNTLGEFDGLDLENEKDQEEWNDLHTYLFNCIKYDDPDACYQLKEGVKFSDIMDEDSCIHVIDFFRDAFNDDEYKDIAWYFIVRDRLFEMGVIDDRDGMHKYLDEGIERVIRNDQRS